MPVRDHHEIDGSEIDSQDPDVVGEDISVVAGVEEDPLPVVLDERREAPVTSEAGAVPEGIVQDRNAIRRNRRYGVCGQRNSAGQNDARWMSKSHGANS